MADRTSAGIFGDIFTHLADEEADLSREGLARVIWSLMLRGGYDFAYQQMECDTALERLGLLERRRTSDGEVEYLYGPEGDRR